CVLTASSAASSRRRPSSPLQKEMPRAAPAARQRAAETARPEDARGSCCHTSFSTCGRVGTSFSASSSRRTTGGSAKAGRPASGTWRRAATPWRGTTGPTRICSGGVPDSCRIRSRTKTTPTPTTRRARTRTATTSGR
ncbi:unnamed protein product, partial [Phaeothamnion confervicola]